MRELLTRELGGELEVRSESERIVSARLLKWGEVADTPQGRERFVKGALKGVDPETVTLEAIGPHGAEPGVRLAGRATAIVERDDGPHGEFRVSRTAAGDELLELVRDKVYRRVSVVFAPVDGGSVTGDDGVIERRAVTLVRVGIVERGAYPGAEVLGVRSSAMAVEPIPDPTPKPVPDPEPKPVPPDPEPKPTLTVLQRDAGIDALRDDMLARMALLEAGAGAGHFGGPLARFATFVDYLDASFADPLLARVLANQISSESPGVIPPSWVQEIAGILEFPRPAITALGGARSLGDSGMELDWPYLDPALNLDTLVAAQATEKTEIASVKVKILKGSSPIATYAGGSDVSYQLIRRSRPSYREAYVRILTIAYARTTEAVFEAALLAGAGSSAVLTATANADAVRAFLFAASGTVMQNTGAPASVDLVSPTEFGRLGGLAGLFPTNYGTSNVPGTADAGSLQINISGLPVIMAPFLTGNQHLVTNRAAAAWHEDGPFPISAEDVAKLGQNVAVWGMGTTAIYVPKGIVKSTLT